MAPRRCSSRVPSTMPATCSRSVTSSSPNTETTRSSTATRSRRGAWPPTARSSMSTRELACAVIAIVFAGCASAQVETAGAQTQTPNLGRTATPAEIAGWDISVGPDGVGLPPGGGTPVKGAAVYEQKCQACHGTKGVGQPNDRLVGGQGTLATKTPVRTIGSYWPYATTVFDYVRRAMP